MNDPGRDAPPWPAPAKLNLFLHVVGRRADGMHLLQTVFQFLQLSDELYFKLREDGHTRHLNPLPGVAAESDLTIRAARLLQTHTGTTRGVDIRIDKRLPMGGGLGGGSSDCATTMVALNHLWGLGLTVDELAELGLALGADVPVFVRGRAAWAEGVGEQLTPLELEEPWFVVIHPGCEVATGRVFGAPDLTRSTAPMTIRAFLTGNDPARACHNDCEPVVRRLFAPVAEALDWLGQHAPAHLTGTGACVFARFDSRAEAEAVLAAVPRGWQGYLARGLNRSPLLDRLELAAG
jgi:4-diphosphocytidyl-2-C-methyl-D-erythritol kinase